MPGGDYLRRERAVAVDLFADEQEGRDGATTGERFEDGGGAGRVGPVVEAHRNRPRDGDPAGYSQRPGDGGHDRGQGRRRPGGPGGRGDDRRCGAGASG